MKSSEFLFNPGDLIQHKATGKVGVVLRSYVVQNDNAPQHESYVRCLASTGIDSNSILSAPQESLVLVSRAVEVCQ